VNKGKSGLLFPKWGALASPVSTPPKTEMKDKKI